MAANCVTEMLVGDKNLFEVKKESIIDLTSLNQIINFEEFSELLSERRKPILP